MNDLHTIQRPSKGEAGESAKLDLLHDDGGATFVEYITIVVLVAIFSMAAWSLWRRAVAHDADEQYVTFGTPPDPP